MCSICNVGGEETLSDFDIREMIIETNVGHGEYSGKGNSPRINANWNNGRLSPMAKSILSCLLEVNDDRHQELNKLFDTKIPVSYTMLEISEKMRSLGYKSKTYYDVINLLIDKNLVRVTFENGSNIKLYQFNPDIVNVALFNSLQEILPVNEMAGTW